MNLSNMEKIGIGFTVVAVICLICEVMEIETLSYITRFGSYFAAFGASMWGFGYSKKQKKEKTKN